MALRSELLFQSRPAQFRSPLEQVQRGLGLRDMVRQDQAGQMQMDQQQQQMAKAQQMQQAILDANGDEEQFLQAWAKIDPAAAAKYKQDQATAKAAWDKQQADIDKTKTDTSKTQEELRMSRLRNLHGSMQGMKPEFVPAAYGQARRDLGAILGSEAPADLAGFEQQVGMPFADYLATQVGPRERKTTNINGVVADTQTGEEVYRAPGAGLIETSPGATLFDPHKGEGLFTAPNPALDETRRHNKAMEEQSKLDRESREKLAEDRIEAAAEQAIRTGKSSKTVSQAMTLANRYEGNALVKNYATVKQAVDFVKTLTPTSTDDQALIYAFAKAMDPDSVVREGEYATVQKYAQSWAEAFKFNASRVFSNGPFLSVEARKQIIATIEKKAKSAEQSYTNYRNETMKKYNEIGEDPNVWLVDYGAVQAGNPNATDNPYR